MRKIGFGNLQDIQDGAVVILGTGIGGCLIKDHKFIQENIFQRVNFLLLRPII